MTLGEKLKSLREERGMFQRDLAELLGVGVSTISGYEKDLKRPKSSNLKKIADFYGVTIDYLLGNENNLSDLEEDFSEGVKVLRRANTQLTDEQKKKMIELMDWFLNNEMNKQ